jgi:DnaJ-class molecular chaperone
MLGPIGWSLAGAGVVAGGIGFLNQWFKRNDRKLTTVAIAIIIAIGDNPYEWFGFQDTASLVEVKQAYRAMMKTLHPDLLQKYLPEWVKHHFNELLLKTQESYEQIKKYQT